jgi:hypothetical protein
MILNRKERQQLHDIVGALNMIPGDKLEDAAPAIITAFTGCPSFVWTHLDNMIGNARPTGLARPYLLRQLRNSPHWGPQLCAVLGN